MLDQFAMIHIAIRVQLWGFTMTLNSANGMLIRQWGERFRKDRLAASVVADLSDRSDQIWQQTFELLQRESPEYRNSVDEEFTKESKRHCNELLKVIITVVAGRIDRLDTDPFDFVRKHAEWRARHQVPLTASLHAYRLAHKTYWGITRRSLLQYSKQDKAILSLAMLSDFWIEFFDCVGTVLAEAHAVEEGLIVAQSTRAYVGLMDDLLRGLPPKHAEAQRLCVLCGIRTGAPMAVVVARPLQPGDGKTIDLEVLLRSFVRLLDQALPSTTFGKLVDIRNGEVTAIVSSDIDAARGLLGALRRNGSVRRARNDHAVGAGISLDTVETSHLPGALEEARLALDFASAAQPLVHFSDIDLPELLIRRADRAAFRLIPEWGRRFSLANDDQSRERTRTIYTFAECSFSVKQTALRLGVHPNTVYFRLNRINKRTGIDPRTYSGTSLLLTVLRLQEFYGSKENSPH
jgi:hypothetical protein